MSFEGLPSWLTGALGLFTLAVVAVMYSVRWRMPQRIVSTTALWQGVLARGRGAGRLGTLEHLASLLLQVLIAVALVLAVGQPRFGCQSAAGRSRVIVLDVSPSMGTLERVETRLEMARRRALAAVAAGAGTDKLALVLAGGTPEVAVPLGHPTAELQRAISGAGLRYTPGSLAAGVERACSLLAGGAGSVVVFTDGFEEIGDCPGAELDVVTIGEPRPNVGVTAFSTAVAANDPAHGVAFLKVTNAWKAPVTAEVRVVLDDKLIEVWPVEIAAGGSAHRSITGLPIGDRGLLEARLAKIKFDDNAVDAMKDDDRAFAVLARRERLPIDLVGVSEPLRLVLQANPRYAVTARPSLAAAQAPVRVVVGAISGPLPEGRYLLIDPRGAQLPFTVGGTVTEPKMSRWNDRHPVLRRVVLSDLSIAEASTLGLPASATALVSSLSTPLIFALDDAQRRVVGIGFKLEQSNLPLRVGFPVLVYNAIDWLLDAKAVDEGSELLRTDSAVRVVTPSKQTVQLEPVNGVVRVPQDEIGFHRVSALDGRPLQTLAVSVVAERETLGGAQRASSTTPRSGRTRDREPWIGLMALALALLLLEWVTFQRRTTV